MEFYATVPLPAPAEKLQSLIQIPALPRLCASVDRVLAHDGEAGRIYCVWGEFDVERQRIRNGVRFTLPGCPNALAWTVTGEGEGVVIHCTINRVEHDPDFIESLETFVADWVAGLGAALTEAA